MGREKYKERRMPVRSYDHAKRDPIKNYFPLPNEIFVLGLNAGEIAVYAYLLFCEDRVTFQCWPSCRSIGRATGMSVNTVRKYIRSLEAKGLITTEPTTITDRHGRKLSLIHISRRMDELVWCLRTARCPLSLAVRARSERTSSTLTLWTCLLYTSRCV